MTDHPDFKSLLDSGIPSPSAVVGKLKLLFKPLAGRQFQELEGLIRAEAYQENPPSPGSRYDSTQRNSAYLAECFPGASSTHTRTVLSEAQEEEAIGRAEAAASEIIAALEDRYTAIMSRRLHYLEHLFTGFRELAKEMDDELVRDIDNVTDLIRDWKGDAGDVLWNSFGEPLATAAQNHRDMTRAVANAAEALHAVQTKAIKHLDEITDATVEALVDIETSAAVPIILTIVAGATTVASAGGSTALIAVEWASASALAGAAASTLPLERHYENPISAEALGKLIEDLHATLDTMEEIMAGEQQAFAKGLTDFIEEYRKLYRDTDQSISSRVVPRAARSEG